MRVHFTDITIRTFKPGAYWDDATPGFGVRVGKRAKTWTVMRGLTGSASPSAAIPTCRSPTPGRRRSGSYPKNAG